MSLKMEYARQRRLLLFSSVACNYSNDASLLSFHEKITWEWIRLTRYWWLCGKSYFEINLIRIRRILFERNPRFYAMIRIEYFILLELLSYNMNRFQWMISIEMNWTNLLQLRWKFGRNINYTFEEKKWEERFLFERIITESIDRLWLTFNRNFIPILIVDE